MGLVLEILLPLVFYLAYYYHKGFVKPFAGLIFIFLGFIRKKDQGGPPAEIGLKTKNRSNDFKIGYFRRIDTSERGKGKLCRQCLSGKTKDHPKFDF